ncbi:hypothetical protein AVEN_83110-1 [Araneus ventricosus]|uniref:Uncharacterized protein n=1 Tax=Araneus ventricosus TaxID=182803 RepID=A0A4Y2AMK3_ARAVE|nr:hypothetical protein AVEN_83110-1 [Araneus ventricosus]
MTSLFIVLIAHWNNNGECLQMVYLLEAIYFPWIAVEDICSYYSNFSIQKPIENFRNSKYLEILGEVPSILSLAPWLKIDARTSSLRNDSHFNPNDHHPSSFAHIWTSQQPLLLRVQSRKHYRTYSFNLQEVFAPQKDLLLET